MRTINPARPLLQPTFPFPTKGGGVVYFRPAFPFFFDKLVFNIQDQSFSSEAGLGDISFDLGYGYTNKKTGFLAAGGIVSTLPTATSSELGPDNLTLGPEMLLGLLRPDSGEISVDNVCIDEERVKEWRKCIGYVPQDTFLLNNSIKENLLRFNPAAKEAEIEEALELAAAKEFVDKLPKGIDTVIGDRGVRLSGGERQRIILARALLRKPLLLVLDEATSSLDNENEHKIQKAIENLRGQTTIVVIAHRLSTIKGADNVIVVENGEILESGPYLELETKENGYLKRMLEIKNR